MAYGVHNLVSAERVAEVTADSLLNVDLVNANHGLARAIMAYPEIDSGSDFVTPLVVTMQVGKGGGSKAVPLVPGVLYPIFVRKVTSIGGADTVYLFW